MPASNTLDCFHEFVGQRLVGLTLGRTPSGSEVRTLVFEDGRGLSISSNGSYWVSPAEVVRCRIDEMRDELERTRRDIERVLALSGEVP